MQVKNATHHVQVRTMLPVGKRTMLPVGKGYRKYASTVKLRALVRIVVERVFVYMADKKHNVEIVKRQGFREQVLKYVSMIKGRACVKYAEDHKYVYMEIARGCVRCVTLHAAYVMAPCCVGKIALAASNVAKETGGDETAPLPSPPPPPPPPTPEFWGTLY